ncbi:MAG: SPFH domain-containing protein [Steroidobacteraceae bacterium]
MAARLATLLLLLALLLAATLYTVPEDQTVLRLRGGAVVERDLAPGLHARVPLLERIVRIQAGGYATRATGIDVTTADGKAVGVEADVRWRVADAGAFVDKLDADAAAAGRRLQGDAGAAIHAACASRTLAELIGTRDPQLLAPAVAAVNARVRELGIEVTGLGLQRLDLKDAAAQAVQQAMQRGFQAQLAEERERAESEADQLRAEADQQGAEALAAAQKEAQRIRGQGEAQAALVYAHAWGASPEFAAFYRSLAAYRATLGREGDVLVLTPDGEFFKYLHNPARH